MARGRGGAGGVWAGPLTSPLPAAEGLKKLFSGATMASSRGMLVTVGQVRLLLGGGRDPGRLASALREVPQEGSGHGMRAGRGLVGPPPPGVVTVGDPQSRWFGLCPAGGVGLGCFPRAGGSPSCPDLSALPQLSCYDQAKQLVLSTGHLSDGIFTHFIASFIAVSGGVPLGGSQGSERQQALASLLEAPRVPQSLGWDGPR